MSTRMGNSQLRWPRFGAYYCPTQNATHSLCGHSIAGQDGPHICRTDVLLQAALQWEQVADPGTGVTSVSTCCMNVNLKLTLPSDPKGYLSQLEPRRPLLLEPDAWGVRFLASVRIQR
jgi:hypothetical protein